MNVSNTLSKAEAIISGLSRKEKSRIFRHLEKELSAGDKSITKRPSVMGGAACVRDTRIAVWVLVQAKQQGVSEAEILRNYPTLTAFDLTNAWNYWSAHKKEIEKAIRTNEADD